MYHFNIPDMTCGGCARSVTKALQSVDANARIDTDPAKREVRVESSADEAAFRAVLMQAGYPADEKLPAA
ncbi:heavy-metal-associated domain-containing protein [Methylobacterium nodulans]|uniref:Heavy metal transport/detoxification protein n=1 Tax=Methylobacterium nodulans (strain LMG 21967 / CNCM I-2342 / ORS 2060) TaxID=460265 RepID=B8IXS0_METNO|nr:heavy-metal-associated domain-containing protein [Methylobacterium nodulans]ACL62902.1 Heavy metal transport/detoxification protein [Methylobacterium nodulans ORS 2060]